MPLVLLKYNNSGKYFDKNSIKNNMWKADRSPSEVFKE
jgi:hypothetical protein